MAKGVTVNIVEYPDRDMLAIDVANLLAGELESALLTHETASLALPGGTTPGPIYDVLCAAVLDWSRVRVMLTDERWVDEESPASNAALLRSRLLTDRAAQAQFKPFYRAGKTPSDAAPEVSASIEGDLPISVLVLGMGDDMHTASLFPGAKGLVEAMSPNAPHICPIEASGHIASRVTLSARVLSGAMSKHLVIMGASKREALERAMTLDPSEAPVRVALNQATVHWAE